MPRPLEYTSISPVWAFKSSVPLAKVGGAGAGAVAGGVGVSVGVGVGVEVVEPELELEPEPVVPELLDEVEPAEPVEADVVEPLEVDEVAGVVEVELGVVVGGVVVVDVVVGGVVVVDVELCDGLVDVELDEEDVELDDEGANETGHDWLVVGVPGAVPLVEDALDVDVAAGDVAGACIDVGVDAFEAAAAGEVVDGLVVLVVLAAGIDALPPTLV